MPPQSSTRKILIKVDAPGVKEALDSMAKSMGMLNRNTKSLAGNMGFLTNTFRAWVGFLGVRELTRMSDEMQNLSNRLKITTNSGEDVGKVLESISAIADRTNQSVSETGVVFNRMSQALKSTGASSKEILALTESLINTFRISGANTAETTNGIVQLSQAFNKGKLDGDEFRSVMEQNVVIAQALKEKFGADIYEKASKGAIKTKDIIQFLSDNVGKLNEQASKLAPTFEQTLTKAFNSVSISVDKMNKEFDLSGKFATVMAFAVGHLAEILTILGGVLLVVAVTRIPAMVSALSTLSLAFLSFSAKNPLILAFSAIASVGLIIHENWSSLEPLFAKLRATMLDFAADVEEAFFSMNNRVAGFLGTTLRPEAVIDSVNSIAQLRQRAIDLRNSTLPQEGPQQDPGAEQARLLKNLLSGMQDAKEKAKSLKTELGELNKAYSYHNITLSEYNEKLIQFDVDKVNRQFAEGRYDIFKYNEELRKLELAEINRQFNKSAISLDQFNNSVATSRLEVLNQQLSAGKIGLVEFNAELTKLEDKVRVGSGFYTGVHDFIESAGTVSQGVARVTSQAFDHLSTTLANFIKKGKFDFAEFTRAILDDITLMIVRASIVRPIAQGILSLADGLGGGAPAGAGAFGQVPTRDFASGGIMTSRGALPLNKYASGGIANSPQVAMFGEGRRPEAYVPLPDGRSIPVSMEGGGGGITFSQTIIINEDGSTKSSEKGSGQGAKELGNLMKQVAIDTIIQQKRPGGVLA